MKISKYFIIAITLLFAFGGTDVYAKSTREERKLIMDGNELYKNRKFKDAAKKYEEAIVVNSETVVARYNLGLAQIKQVTNPQDTTPKNQSLLGSARQNLGEVAKMAATKPGLASKANYNLGNLEFNSKEYQKAIDYYKMALRIDPKDEAARKNLRIAQKQLQNQNQDNKQNQDQNKDKDKDKDKDNKQNQNQDNKQDQNKDKKEDKQEQNKINQQAADQILQANQNKENQTRARVNRATKGDKNTESGYSRRRW